MPVTIDTGLVATDDPLAADLAVSMDEEVGKLDKDTSQLTSILMSRLPVATARSFKEEWMNDELLPKNCSLSASAATATTAFTITTGEGPYGKVGDIVLIVESGEHVRITGSAADAWTVVRAVGSVAAATAQSGTSLGGLMIVNGSNSQGGTLPTAIITEKVADYNYAGIVRNSYRFTSTAEWTRWYSGNPLAYHRKKIGIEHKRELEQELFFGARSYTADGGNGAPRSSFGGIKHYVSATTDIAGTMDKGEFADFLREAMEYGDRNRKALFAAPLVSQVLSEFLQDNWVRARPEDNIWGVKVDAVIEPSFVGARIPVFVKGDWKRFGEGTGKHIGSRAYLLDLSQIELKKAPATMNGPRFASLYSKRQANDADEVAEEFLSEVTLVVKTPRAHRELTGVTG